MQKKQKLIELVVQTHMSIYKAAKRLNICHPTAKFIMKNYRKTEGQVIHPKEPLEAPVENNQLPRPQQI
jgi:transposase-like protein